MKALTIMIQVDAHPTNSLEAIMRSVLALAALLAAGTSAHAGDVTLKLPPTIGYFSIDPGTGEGTRVAVGFGPLSGGDDQTEQWFMLGSAPSGTRPTSLRWATTRTCPAARNLIGTLRDLDMPQFAAPDEGDDPKPGGVVYVLETRVAFHDNSKGEIRLTAGKNTPLAQWIDGAFATLEDCWDERGPSDAGR